MIVVEIVRNLVSLLVVTEKGKRMTNQCQI